MIRRILLSSLVLVSLSACTAFDRPARVDPRVAAQVQVDRVDPPPGCGYLGPVKGATLVGDVGEAQGDLVRNAVLNGGNYVAVDMIERPMMAGVGGYTLRGRLFACPAQPQTPQAARPPVQIASVGPEHAAQASDAVVLPRAICEPECSPGFTCLHAVCVTACNPSCGTGEQCGADRACHAK